MIAGGSRIRRRHSIPLAAVLFAATMGLTTSACAGGSTDGTDQRESSSSPAARSSAGKQGLRLARVANLRRPVEVKAAPGFPKLMFVVEQEGRIMVIRRGRKLARPFLNIKNRVSSGGERGLLSVAFPPGYRKSKRFYVYYTDNTGDIRVDEFRRRTAVTALRRTRRGVIRIGHRVNSNHNGGQMHFLGRNLYFGTGDGGGGGDQPGNAQNLNSLLGKMIRIDPRRRGGRSYTVPRSNPFVGRDGKNQIFAYGLRNPFRWSFDRVTGKNVRMVIADVGESEFEEVNYLSLAKAKGANFGWNRFEGFNVFDSSLSGTTKPSIVLRHSEGNCSVIGGLVVRDNGLRSIRGRYLFADFCKGDLRTFRPRAGRIKSTSATGLNVAQISSFGESLRGAVYATSLSGRVYRLRQ